MTAPAFGDLAAQGRRWAPALLVALLAAWLGAAGAGLAIKTAYLATATVQVLAAPAPPAPNNPDTLAAGTRQAPTYARLATSTAVLRAALIRAQAGGTPAQLGARVEVTLLPGTDLLTLGVYDDDPVAGARLANALAAALIAYAEDHRRAAVAATLAGLTRQIAAQEAAITALTAQQGASASPVRGSPATAQPALAARLAQATQGLTQLRGTLAFLQTQAAVNGARPLLRLAEAATPPPAPISAASALTYVLVSGVGLLLALAALLLVARADNRLAGPADLRGPLALPLLGAIPPADRSGTSHL